MAKMKARPSVKEYFETLKAGFEYQEKILTRVLPHFGEQGRNNEEFLKRYLQKFLPKKFCIGTGFIVCSDASKDISKQQDVVIYDELQNSPIFQEYAASVFPIESVYAFVEVKTTLRKADLEKAIDNIGQVRQMASHKSYVEYVSVPRGKGSVSMPVQQSGDLPPRSYIFAYSIDKRKWPTLDHLKSYLEKNMGNSAHLHGLLVVQEGWFLHQEAHSPDGVKIHATEGDGLLRFSQALLHHISSFPMKPASLDRYVE